MKKEIGYYAILLLYLETVFHWYMGLDFKYIAVFGGFAIVYGLILSIPTLVFPRKVRNGIRAVLSLLSATFFCVEIICRDTLQQYFQLFSAMDTAAENRLSDYWSAIRTSLIENCWGLALLLVIPGLFWTLTTLRGSKKEIPAKKRVCTMLLLLPICVSLYVGVLAVVNKFPWEGDFTPKMLYKMDTNTDDQVEQLGLLTMLRLDAKHSLFGVEAEVVVDLDELPPVEEIVEEEQAVRYEPNKMYIKLQTLLNNTKSENVKWLTEYFQRTNPTMKNEYTGMFEGYNVIFITAEGFSGYMIDPEMTPTLYKLSHEGFVFNNFYSALHFTSTSGGEFQNLTGLYPKNGFPISMKETGVQKTYLPFTLANVLGGQGYTTIGYHYNENMYGRDLSHPNLGYDWRQASHCTNKVQKEKDPNGIVYWPQSDDYMIEASVNDYIGEEPFHIYYLTLSGHLPYSYGGSMMSGRNREAVAHLPYTEKTKAYIAANLELEKGLTRLIGELEAAGIADRTLLVLSPDHIPYSDVDTLAELAGQSFGTDSLESLDESAIDFDVYKNSLIMWSASMTEPVEVDKVCCQVDILPTLLNLLGVEFDSRLFAGTDILSTSEGLVVFSSNSWISDKGMYNRFTEKFTPSANCDLTAEKLERYVSQMKTTVSCKLAMTSAIIENDYYKLLLE
jgi:phosphoglycerol transferase MdoB-like AlkP superfamily enzyme